MKYLLLVLTAVGCLALASGCGDGAKNALGDACGAGSECEGGTCHNGICVSPTPVDNGADCTMGAECKSLVCTSGKCATGAALADAVCLNKEECASGLCTSGKCVLKADGAACTQGSECSGGTCYNLLCTSKKGDGTTCSADTDCAGGTCYALKCTSKKSDGTACTADTDCAGNVCYSSKCAKTCTKSTDCTSGDSCGSDDGKRLFCYTPAYDKDIGKFCGIDGACGSLTCLGTTGDALAFCSTSCKTDLDCPPAFTCEKQTGGKTYCIRRSFCSPCLGDENCPSDQKCVSMFGAKYCTRTCTKGGSDCPMYADCKDPGDGTYVCQHKQGKCVSDGSLCSPCTKSDNCQSGGLCLTFTLSGESFCGTDCTSSGTCSTGYTCSSVSSTAKQCVPDAKGTTPYYTCTSGITYPTLQVGDILEDFAMVGYKDLDGSGTTTGKKLEVIKLSDYASRAKVIVLNIMTFW